MFLRADLLSLNKTFETGTKKDRFLGGRIGRSEANNQNSPFVNLNDLYNPDLSKFDFKSDQQKFDLLKERQRLQEQPLKGPGDLDKLLKQEEAFR